MDPWRCRGRGRTLIPSSNRDVAGDRATLPGPLGFNFRRSDSHNVGSHQILLVRALWRLCSPGAPLFEKPTRLEYESALLF